MVFQLSGDYDAADAELRKIIAREPTNPEFLLRLGVLHTERFSHATDPSEKNLAAQTAEHWLREVLKIQPDNVLASRALEQVSRRP